MKRYLKKNESGFTLIEVLIVVVLIAILALVALMAINPARQRGKLYDVKRKRDLNQLKGIYDLYYNKNLRFPTGEEVCYDDPVDEGGGMCSCHICGLEQDVGTFRDYLQVLYCDPEYSRKSYLYEYECSAQPGWYKLYSTLSQETTDGGVCTYGVTNRSDQFLDPLTNSCESGNAGGASGGGGGETGGGGGGTGGGGGGSPTATPTPTPISCPADPVPKYCMLGGICNICGTHSNCLNPASCDQPAQLFDDSLCTNRCQ